MVNSLEHVDVGYDNGCITLWIYQNPLNCKFLKEWVVWHASYISIKPIKQKKNHIPHTHFTYVKYTWECGSLGESGALSGDILLNIYGCCWKSLQSCPTLCDPIDGSPPGSPIPGILQARILEWVAISFWLLYWTTQRQVQCGWNLDWQKEDWRRGKSDEVLNDDNVAKMAG